MQSLYMMSQVAHQVRAYSSFHSMKQLGVFLLPPGWDANPLQCYPSIKFASTLHYQSQVSCPRTQHKVSGQLELDRLIWK